MRVLHLNSLLRGGGTDDQCLRVVAGLRALGVTATIAGPPDAPWSARAGDALQPTPPEGPLNLRYIAAVARMLRTDRHEIVHAHHGRDLWPMLLAARLSGARPRIVLTRHLAKSPGSIVSRWVFLNRCDAVIAVSDFVARVLREGHRDPASPERERHHRPPVRGDHRRIHVIPCAVDTDRFRPRAAEDASVTALRGAWGLAPGGFAFGVAGGFEAPRGKGQREFLRAAAAVKDALPQARFLIIGRGSLEAALRADIAALGLAACARIVPWHDDMPAVMNACDALVHPQIGTESFGLVVAEAHACGRPVIASALDGIPEAFAPGGLGRLVPSEDVPALAAALREVAGEKPPDAAQRTAAHARVEAAFAPPRIAARTRALYEALLTR